MKKLTHSTVQYLLVTLILTLLSLSCNQQPPMADQGFKTSEADTTQPYVVNWDGDTIPTGIPINIKGQYYPADSFPEPTPVKGIKLPRAVPAYSNKIPVNIKPKVVQVPDSLKTITPGENGVPLPDTVHMKVTVTPVKHPKPVLALTPGISNNAKFDIQYFNSSHGLLDAKINDILADSKGNLWFSTMEGLSCFDGKYFMHYTINEGLPGNNILDVFEDSKGNLWIEVQGIKGNGSIIKFDGHSFIHYAIQTFTTGRGPGTCTFQEDQNGNIWIKGWEENFKLYKYLGKENDTARFIYYSKKHGLPPLNENSIFIDNKDNIWMVGERGGVIRFDGRSFTYLTVSQNGVDISLQDTQGRIWISTLAGIDVLQYNTEGEIATISQYDFGRNELKNPIGRLFKDQKGDIWYASGWADFEMGRLDINESREITQIIKFDRSNGINGYSNLTIEMDYRGNIWTGTRNGGVNWINLNSFNNYYTHNSKQDSVGFAVVSSITEDDNGHLWFGSETNGGGSVVRRYDGNNFYSYWGGHGLVYPRAVRSVFKDSRGHLWFIYPIGFTRYDGHLFYHYPNYIFKNGCCNWMGFEDTKGDVWFTGSTVISVRFDKNGRVLDYISFTGNRYINSVSQVAEDKYGNLWMGTWTAGLIRYKKGINWGEVEVTFITKNEGLVSNNVQALEIDSKGNLWIGTANGGISFLSEKDLGSYHPDFINFTKEDGLKSNIVASVIEDDKNNIWISTANEIGLFEKLDDDDLVVIPPKIPDYKFHSFDHLDGVRQKEFVWRSVLKDSQNRLWWGSHDGATVLDLNKFEIPTDSPENVHLIDLEINQQHIEYGNLKDTAYQNSLEFGKVLSHSFDSIAQFNNYPINLSLPYNINHLTFHFSSIDWGAPHKIKYSYKIDGLDDDWSPLQSDPKADYRNLPPGKHTLKVKAIGEAQVWSDTFEYFFTIRPPWWQTTWAYLGYALVIGLLGYWLYQFLLNRRLEKEEARRLRELDEVKTKLYTNITHEFRTPLTIIKGMTHKMKDNPKRWFSDGINMINRNSDQLLQLINQILDLRKLESGKLSLQPIQSDIIAYLKYHLEAFHSYAEERDIRLHFISEVEELQMDFAPKGLQHIMNNLVSNAIKYNKEGGDVYVSVSKVDGRRTKGERPQKKEFDLRPSTFALQIKIRDTGIGIPPDQLPHIFDRFYQADTEAHRQLAKAGEGTGIGLALSKELVKLMNGEITVKSRVGEGTTFEVLLPITQNKEQVAAAELGVQAQVSSLSSSPAAEVETVTNLASRPQVLIVEDNKDVVYYLQSCLQADYQLEVAHNGAEGLEKALELVPDLIISDVMMPKKDGFELCAELKQDLRTSHIPIILLTAKGDLDSRLEGLEQGADAYLSKPFEEQELLVRMEQMIKLRQKLQEKYGGPLGQMATLSNNTEEQFLQKIYETVTTNLGDENFGIAQLCQAMHLSRTQLHRKLKSLTGKSTSIVIRQIRLQKAKELLSTTDLSISQIAYEVGFSKPGYFTEVFVETYGQTPREYRKD